MLKANLKFAVGAFALAAMRGVSVPMGRDAFTLRYIKPPSHSAMADKGSGCKHSGSSVNGPQRKRRPVQDPAWEETPNIHWNRGRLERAGLRKVRVKVSRTVSRMGRETFKGRDGQVFRGRRNAVEMVPKGWKWMTVLERIPAAA